MFKLVFMHVVVHAVGYRGDQQFAVILGDEHIVPLTLAGQELILVNHHVGHS